MRRFVAKLLFGMILVMSFGLMGCGSSGKPIDDGAVEDGGDQTEDSIVTLTILKAEAQNTAAWEAVCTKFTEEHPNIQVIVEAYDNELPSVLATRFASGEDPDIFATQPYEFGRPYLEYCYDIAEEEILDNVDPSTIESTTLDGVVTGICMYGDAEGLIYNKTVFDELNLSAPTTIDEFENVCKILKEAGYTPLSNGFKEGWVLQDILSAFMGAQGNLIETAQKIGSGEMTFADLTYIDNMFDFIDICLMYDTGKSLETGYYEQISDLGSGKAVMTTQGNWMEQEAVAIDPELKLSFCPIPVDHSEDLGAIEVSPAWVYHISKNSAHIEEALTFLDWLITSEEGRRFICEDIGKLPLLPGEVQMVGNLNADATEAVQAEKSRDIEQYFQPAGFENSVGEAFQMYIAGRASREEVLTMLTEEWVRLVNTAE